ncbi:MAG: glutathione peroxidase [Myxococcota bacterium]|nr:glutathione peroxidase [Myxococcota bacterium]
MQIIAEGQRIPDLSLRVREDGQWKDVTTGELFAGRTVVVFGLPGAFTPTCSASHVPRYEELASELLRCGVDEIACVSVNDAFVMEAWGAQQSVEKVRLLPDGNGDLTRALGLLVDKRDLGFGPRSRRYSMLVKDGVVAKLFVEKDAPGDPYDVSDADTMLRYLTDDAPPRPLDIAMVSKPGCAHCARARTLLKKAGLSWQEVPSTPRVLRAIAGASTTPQVFVDGQRIGGADQLEAWLAKRTG